MSIREASRVFGLHRDTVSKMLAYSVPPGYRRKSPPRRPKLDAYTGVIVRIPDDDHRFPGSSGTQPSASSSGSGTSTASTADTPSSRTTSVSIAVRQKRCSCRCPTRRATPSATSARPWWSSAAWSGRPTASSSTCPTATAALSRPTLRRGVTESSWEGEFTKMARDGSLLGG